MNGKRHRKSRMANDRSNCYGNEKHGNRDSRRLHIAHVLKDFFSHHILRMHANSHSMRKIKPFFLSCLSTPQSQMTWSVAFHSSHPTISRSSSCVRVCATWVLTKQKHHTDKPYTQRRTTYEHIIFIEAIHWGHPSIRPSVHSSVRSSVRLTNWETEHVSTHIRTVTVNGRPIAPHNPLPPLSLLLL